MAIFDVNSDGSYIPGTNRLSYNNITYIRISKGRFDPPSHPQATTIFTLLAVSGLMVLFPGDPRHCGARIFSHYSDGSKSLVCLSWLFPGAEPLGPTPLCWFPGLSWLVGLPPAFSSKKDLISFDFLVSTRFFPQK